MRYLELLAPARDLACGMAAISHGADAVYIGADRFGARAAAGNTVDDIGRLCRYAHRYGAKVYVTVNTIIYEQELQDTQRLITDLSQTGVDALLVQDMATLEMRRIALQEVGYAPVLHASTQMDNRTVEKVRWLKSLGFTRAVLARELSVEEIRAIHKAVPGIELEVFVHGALCVSYSGQCYASQHLLGRSANRGECAQVCRMRFDFTDAEGETIVKDRYLLSMKDLCQIDRLEELADAGATSFKIEGRLKGEDYVKNVVSAYSRRLDAIIKKRPNDYCRASWGEVSSQASLMRSGKGASPAAWHPDLNKTFNRGYTTYFAEGRQKGLCTMLTPKALGEFVGAVKELHPQWFSIAPPGRRRTGGETVSPSGRRESGSVAFANGDGLCFIDDSHELSGFRVNRVEGGRLYPFHMPKGLKPGVPLYRNNDVAFEKVLQNDDTRRLISVDMYLGTTANGFVLQMSFDANGNRAEGMAAIDFEHQQARSPQKENMRRQLSRLGNTVYQAKDIAIDDKAGNMFVPSSLLAELRRKAVASLDEACMDMVHHARQKEEAAPRSETEHAPAPWSPEYRRYTYLYNVANHAAREFYKRQGVDITQPAFEVREPKESVVMQCRYCIRYELGYCVRRGGKEPSWKEPLELRLGDGHRFRLEFRCDECQMNIHPIQ